MQQGGVAMIRKIKSIDNFAVFNSFRWIQAFLTTMDNRLILKKSI
jgi:hypothetical protein